MSPECILKSHQDRSDPGHSDCKEWTKQKSDQIQSEKCKTSDLCNQNIKPH